MRNASDLAGYFLDSSAIGKFYHAEVGSPAIEALVSEPGVLYVSRLAVEVPSAFAGKVRAGQLAAAHYAFLYSRFRLDLRRKLFRIVAMNAGHFREAEHLIGA